MKEPPIQLLEALASKEEQLRFIAGGTVGEYLLPEELLNDALHFCERANAPEVRNKLDATQIESIDRLCTALNECGEFLDQYAQEKLFDLVEHDLTWASLRKLSQDVLSAFGNERRMP